MKHEFLPMRMACLTQSPLYWYKMEITAYISEEPQQKYRFGTNSIRLLGLKQVLLHPNPRPAVVRFGPHEDFLTHQ